MGDRVTYEEQEEMGLIRKRQSFVAPLQGEVLPPVKRIPAIPAVHDPYAENAPRTVQQVAKYQAGPITRAQAMVIKTNQVTKFLAILTGAFMLVFRLYPPDLAGLWVFLLWLGIASLEWCLMFAFLAVIDYRETPSAQGWFQMRKYTSMMEKEQEHRLRAMYPEQYDEKGRRKWR